MTLRRQKLQAPAGPKASCEVAHIFPVSIGVEKNDGLVSTESFSSSDGR
jgi:hypothetical protein